MASDSLSRFKNTEKIIANGKETYGIWSSFHFLQERPSDDNIGIYQVTSAKEGRPDLISHALYGTPILDWVLLAFNNVTEVFGWPVAGSAIEYPLDSIVFSELL